MNKVKAVILAAGKGTRMKSDLPKVVHKVMGKPMAEYSIEAAKAAGADEICLVVGYMADEVKKEVKSDVVYRIQEEQLGTGHAVKCAQDFIGDDGDTIILCGDTPLIKGETLKKLADHHREHGNAVTVLTAIIDDPTGYGRIIRDSEGRFVKSVEHKDADDEERKSKEINSGMYMFNSKALSEALGKITNNNVQGEYYLPDALTVIKDMGLKADAMSISDASEIAGVNTPEQLAEAEAVMRARTGC